jgi:F-type H+-transporting ATPase subunit delta
MDQGLIPRRYAKALYKFASERKQDQAIYDLMKQLAATFEQVSDLQTAVTNPFVSNSDKVGLLMSAANVSVVDNAVATQCFVNFLKLLVDNDRLSFVRGIALAYIVLYRKANNIYKVEVVTADAIDDAETSRLKGLISKHLKDATMEYSQSVDSSLIGGFIINIDNEQLDASISNELKQLRLKLLSK